MLVEFFGAFQKLNGQGALVVELGVGASDLDSGLADEDVASPKLTLDFVCDLVGAADLAIKLIAANLDKGGADTALHQVHQRAGAEPMTPPTQRAV